MKIKWVAGASALSFGLAIAGVAFAQSSTSGRVCGSDPGASSSTCSTLGNGFLTAPGIITTSIGFNSGVLNTSTNGTAIGNNAQVSAVNGSAFGGNSQATATNSTALGASSISSGVGSVAIGAGSDDGGRAGVVSVGSAPSVLQPGGITRQIINVAAGTVSATSTDAINGSQLFAVQQLASQAAIGANAVTYDNAAHTSVTLNIGGAPTQLHNLAAGTAATDAANVAQLTAAFNSAVATSQTYTDQRVNALSGQFADLSSRVAKVARDANAGTASAIASSNIPQAVTGGRTTLGGAVGSWNGEAAFAIGASHMFDGNRFSVRGSANFDSRGSTGGGVGFGVSF